jgi:hypothetical protein
MGKVDRWHIRGFAESMATMRKHLVRAGRLNYPNWPLVTRATLSLNVDMKCSLVLLDAAEEKMR